MAVHPIFSLILANNLIEVISLIQSDPGAVDARKSDLHNWFPLHYSCYYNRVDITVHLVKHGADVDCREEQGGTPLHIAASANMGCLEIVKFLANLTSNPHIRNIYGKSPMDLALKNGHSDIVAYLNKFPYPK